MEKKKEYKEPVLYRVDGKKRVFGECVFSGSGDFDRCLESGISAFDACLFNGIEAQNDCGGMGLGF